MRADGRNLRFCNAFGRVEHANALSRTIDRFSGGQPSSPSGKAVPLARIQLGLVVSHV